MYIREAGARLSFGMETSNRNMHKSVVYETGVDAQLAAHYETCIREMKKKRKRSNRNKELTAHYVDYIQLSTAGAMSHRALNLDPPRCWGQGEDVDSVSFG